MARVDVVMPQMGESIAEGTLSKWLKQVGDPVKRDEPIFEISTDKVDAEIPAPTNGVLAEIRAKRGVVAPRSIVAVIDVGSEVEGHVSMTVWILVETYCSGKQVSSCLGFGVRQVLIGEWPGCLVVSFSH